MRDRSAPGALDRSALVAAQAELKRERADLVRRLAALGGQLLRRPWDLPRIECQRERLTLELSRLDRRRMQLGAEIRKRTQQVTEARVQLPDLEIELARTVEALEDGQAHLAELRAVRTKLSAEVEQLRELARDQEGPR